MRLIRTRKARGHFRVVAETRRSQAATIILKSGQSTGGDDNVHEKSDQWLYVVSGSGLATVKGRRVRLTPGALLLIEAGETHEIRNTGRARLITINVYAPPEY